MHNTERDREERTRKKPRQKDDAITRTKEKKKMHRECVPELISGLTRE